MFFAGKKSKKSGKGQNIKKRKLEYDEFPQKTGKYWNYYYPRHSTPIKRSMTASGCSTEASSSDRNKK